MSRSTAQGNRGPLLGALLRLASQAMTERFNRWIESSEFAGIQPAHSAAIQPLWELPDGRAHHRARARLANHEAIDERADRPISRPTGYVERVDDPDDATSARACDSRHTAARTDDAVRAFARDIETEWAERIGAQRVEELRATLQLLRTKVFLADQ